MRTTVHCRRAPPSTPQQPRAHTDTHAHSPSPTHAHLQRRELVSVLSARARLADALLHVLVALRERDRLLHRAPQPRNEIGVERAAARAAAREAGGELVVCDEPEAVEQRLERAAGGQRGGDALQVAGGRLAHPELEGEGAGAGRAAERIHIAVERLGGAWRVCRVRSSWVEAGRSWRADWLRMSSRCVQAQ